MKITAYDQNNLIIESDLGKTFTILKEIPGRKRWQDRNCIFQPSGINLVYIMENFPDAKWIGEAKQTRDAYILLKQEEDNQIENKLALVVPKSKKKDGYVYETNPLDHQRRSFLLARDQKVWAHLHDQGTGKTKIAIDTTAYLYEKGEIDTLIVVAKNGVHVNWVLREIPKHLPRRIKPSFCDYYSTDNPPSRYREQLKVAQTPSKKLRIITFNVEGFGSEKACELIEAFLFSGTAIFIVDDGSIGNYAAKRVKYLISIREQAEYRRFMTGTPITKGVENLYSQFNFLDPLILGHGTWTSFKNEFCITGFHNQVTGYQNGEKLSKIISGWSDRVLKKDCLDLPPKIYIRLPFEMSPQQAKLYDAYRKDSFDLVQKLLNKEGQEKAAELAITKALRLQQIACGLTPEKNPTRIDGPNPRMAMLMSQIDEAEEAGRKYIVWARFTKDLEEISKKLGKHCVTYVGATSKNDRIRAIDRFQDDKTISGFVGHVMAAGVGLTLTAADRTFYHSNLSSLELRLQSEDRNHRIGSEVFQDVTYGDVEAVYTLGGRLMTTIDRRIIDALRARKKLSEEILKDPTSLFIEEEYKPMTAKQLAEEEKLRRQYEEDATL